jgi:3-phosphoshikimate 1-carboxyvinyltransferase
MTSDPILISLPSDKSITHRAFIFSALSDGPCQLQNVGNGADLGSTRRVLSQLGIKINQENQHTWIVYGKGFMHPFQQSSSPLDCGNSGTTSRLLMGLLGAQKINATLIGDASLSQRPMLRLGKLLNQMGTDIQCSDQGKMPVRINAIDHRIKSGQYHTQSSSAQIKSAMLLAGLYADGEVEISENLLSRDHTERFFQALGIGIQRKNECTVLVEPIHQKIPAFDIDIPGDFSSACFWITASLLSQKRVYLQNVNLNPTRTGFLEIIQKMGAHFEIQNLRLYFGEEIADLLIYPSNLKGIDIDEHLALRAIDELPLFAILAANAIGTSTVKGAKELRVKESDRIEAMALGLKKLGCDIEAREDGWHIEGGVLHGGAISSFSDHRIAASFRIARLKAQGKILIDDESCVDISYPEFNRLFDLCFRI